MLAVVAVRPAAVSPTRPSKMTTAVVMLHAVMMVMLPAVLRFCRTARQGHRNADSQDSGETNQ